MFALDFTVYWVDCTGLNMNKYPREKVITKNGSVLNGSQNGQGLVQLSAIMFLGWML